MSLWMARRDKPLGFSIPAEFLSQVLNLLSAERLLSGIAVLTGNVARTVNRTKIFGKNVESHS